MTCNGAIDCARAACVKSCAALMTEMNAISCMKEKEGSVVAVGIREMVLVRLGWWLMEVVVVSCRARSRLPLVSGSLIEWV